MRITELRDAIALAASDPGNSDYMELFDAACDVANARSDLEISEAEYRETLSKIIAQMQALAAIASVELAHECRKSVSAAEAMTAAETAQRITEIKTGLNK